MDFCKKGSAADVPSKINYGIAQFYRLLKFEGFLENGTYIIVHLLIENTFSDTLFICYLTIVFFFSLEDINTKTKGTCKVPSMYQLFALLSCSNI